MLTESGQWSSSIRQVTDVSGAVVLQIAITSFLTHVWAISFRWQWLKWWTGREVQPSCSGVGHIATLWALHGQNGANPASHIWPKDVRMQHLELVLLWRPTQAANLETYSKHSRCLAHCHWVYWFYGFTDDRNKYSVASWMKELFENIYIRQLRQAGYV